MSNRVTEHMVRIQLWGVCKRLGLPMHDPNGKVAERITHKGDEPNCLLISDYWEACAKGAFTITNDSTSWHVAKYGGARKGMDEKNDGRTSESHPFGEKGGTLRALFDQLYFANGISYWKESRRVK